MYTSCAVNQDSLAAGYLAGGSSVVLPLQIFPIFLKNPKIRVLNVECSGYLRTQNFISGVMPFLSFSVSKTRHIPIVPSQH